MTTTSAGRPGPAPARERGRLGLRASWWRTGDNSGAVVPTLLVLLGTCALGVASTLSAPDGDWPPAASFALFALAALPLLARRRHPRLVLVACTAIEVAHLLVAPALGPLPTVSLPVATTVAAFTAVDVRGLRRTWPLLAGAAAALTAASVLAVDGDRQTVDLLLAYHSVLIASGVGHGVRDRRARLHRWERRALEAEADRLDEARRQVAAERVRIARELHDVLAHHLTLVNAQAGVAEYLVDTDPRAARTALRDITRHTRGALDELRATVGLLRSAEDDDAVTESPAGERELQPLPGLHRLEELLVGARTAGGTVSVTVVGEPRPLSARADLAAFRIVQEALTNARKHALGAAVSVTLTWSEHALRLLVVNGRAVGPAPAAAGGGGHGLVGMRERALAADGTLRVEQPPAGGWLVAADLPTEAVAP